VFPDEPLHLSFGDILTDGQFAEWMGSQGRVLCDFEELSAILRICPEVVLDITQLEVTHTRPSPHPVQHLTTLFNV